MKDFKKQRGRRAQYVRMMGGLAGMTAVALVAFATASAAWGMYGKFAEAASADDISQQELAGLQSQRDSMSATVAQLSTERGMGSAVRARYGMGLPGEGEIDIVRTATSSDPAQEMPRGFWAGLWHAFAVW